jgi:serine/threonine-protein kinase
VWAFGCVLYEMLTGRRAFEGETVTDTLAAVLKSDPDWSALPAETSPAVKRVLRRCLTRDAGKRLGHVSGARLALQETLDGVVEAEPIAAPRSVAPEQPIWKRILPWALVALLAGIAALALWPRAPLAAPAELLSLSAPFPKGQTLPQDQMGIVALSPDGRYMALVLRQGGQQLFLRRMDGDEMVPLAGTTGATSPVFSPDGKWIAFFADQKLKKIAVEGGKPITLCEAGGDNRGASWGADDRIVFASHYAQALSRVSGAGGAVEALTTLDAAKSERTHRWPQVLAQRDVVLFTVGVMDSPESYDDSRIDAVRLSTGERKTVLEGASMARYAPTGHLVFGRDGFLFAVPFDIERLETHGSPVPVVENVMGMRSSGVVHADFSSTGLLTYIAGSPLSRRSRLAWRDRQGRAEPLAAPVAGYAGPRLSPDRKRIAVPVAGGSTFDIWVWDIAREISTRLTFEGDNRDPLWSPDGRRILYTSVRAGSTTITYAKPADGSGVEERLFAPGAEWGRTVPMGFSSDSAKLLYEFSDSKQTNIMVLDPLSGEASVLLQSPAAEGEPTLSPDGRWLAYSSDESGNPDIYVRRFPGLEGRWQVSDGGGVNPRWSPDGRELFYRWRNSLYAAAIRVEGDRFEAERPQELFDDVPPAGGLRADYDVFDRERFLFAEPAEEEQEAAGVTVVVNWLDELARRVPR